MKIIYTYNYNTHICIQIQKYTVIDQKRIIHHMYGIDEAGVTKMESESTETYP